MSAHGGLQDDDLVAEANPHEEEQPEIGRVTPRSSHALAEKVVGKSIQRDVERQNGVRRCLCHDRISV